MEKLFSFLNIYLDQFSRISIFLVYFWFGALKILGTSPAENLVVALQQKTLWFIPSEIFMIILGISEILIGVAFLFPKLTKIVSIIFIAHMFTTILPLFFLWEQTWTTFPSLTIEGQYIIKNIVMISVVWGILVRYLQIGSKSPKVEQPGQVLQK